MEFIPLGYSASSMFLSLDAEQSCSSKLSLPMHIPLGSNTISVYCIFLSYAKMWKNYWRCISLSNVTCDDIINTLHVMSSLPSSTIHLKIQPMTDNLMHVHDLTLHLYQPHAYNLTLVASWLCMDMPSLSLLSTFQHYQLLILCLDLN